MDTEIGKFQRALQAMKIKLSNVIEQGGVSLYGVVCDGLRTTLNI